jgi:hypothetical protein
MTETTLLQAREQFASGLDELRRRLLNEFELWLKAAIASDRGAVQSDAAERITGVRKRLAQDFIDATAPAIIRTLNRDAERDILAALQSYEARFEPQSLPPKALSDYHWQPSLWRTAIGAAFGAVIGVVLLAIGHVGSTSQAPPAGTQQVAPAPPAPPAGPLVQPPSPGSTQSSPSPSREVNVPTPAAPSGPSGNANLPALWLLAAFAAALGAAIGVMLVACPPLEVLLQRAGLRGGALSFVQKFGKAFGGVFLLLRGSAVIALAAVLLSALFGIVAWMFSGAQFSQILLSLMALATILTARWTAPGDRAPDRDALLRGLRGQLADYLRTDAEVWAALSAALVLRPQPQTAPADPGPALRLKEAIDIIESRRQLDEPADTILQILEQNLGLHSGRRSPPPPATPSEFVWQREHADAYATFGVVEIGDVVRVTQRPLFITEPDGTRRVSQKGVVTRKA